MDRIDDEAPQKKAVHVVGQLLDSLSVDELTERIALLKAEIGRLEAEALKKSAVRSAADALFKF